MKPTGRAMLKTGETIHRPWPSYALIFFIRTDLVQATGCISVGVRAFDDALVIDRVIECLYIGSSSHPPCGITVDIFHKHAVDRESDLCVIHRGGLFAQDIAVGAWGGADAPLDYLSWVSERHACLHDGPNRSEQRSRSVERDVPFTMWELGPFSKSAAVARVVYDISALDRSSLTVSTPMATGFNGRHDNATGLDVIDEVNVMTTDYTAEYGHTGGGVMNVVLKSGTNHFHGSEYEFHRHNILYANTFQNKPGGTIGGPVDVPKVYNGKNMMFIFHSLRTPNVDTMQEFKMVTTNYEAEYGHSADGTITVLTKSGTNEFHGTAYRYQRHEMLDANTFQNKPGGTIGGPVDVPKVYNGKNKLFFFCG